MVEGKVGSNPRWKDAIFKIKGKLTQSCYLGIVMHLEKMEIKWVEFPA